MAKTVPSTFTSPSLLQFGTGEDIDSEDFLSVVQAEHHIWSVTGSRLTGLIFDPALTVAGATYTQGSGSGSRNLSGWTGVVAPRRRVLSSGTYYYALTLEVVGANCDIRATFYDSAEPGLGGSWQAVASVVGASYDFASATVLLPVTNDMYLCIVECKHNAAGTARLAQFSIYEAVDPSSYYP